jgi:Ca-activated chloride channel family protein
MQLNGLQLEYISFPAALAVFAAAGAFVVTTGVGNLTHLPMSRRWAAIFSRLILLLLFLLIVGGARWERTNNRLEVIVLRDVGRSTQYVPKPRGQDLQQTIKQWITDAATHKPSDDSIGVISFDGQSRVDAMPATILNWRASSIDESEGGTDVASAINMARAMFTKDAMHRLVLAWNGNATDGDLDAALSASAAAHVPIDVVPLRYCVADAVLMDKLIAPELKREKEPFTLDVLLHNTGQSTASGTLVVKDGSELLSRQRIALSPGANVIHVKAQPRGPGLRRFHAMFEPDARVAGADAIRSADAFTLVRGTGRLLYVDAVEDGGGRPLLEALASQGVTIRAEDHITPEHFPDSATALQAYDAVILADVPRGEGGLSVEQEQLLTSYVHDAGGGLVMIGGPHTFGAGGWIGSSLEKILPVNCSMPANRTMPAGALVVVLDHSGSMGEIVNGSTLSKQQIADEASVLALQTLSPQDYFGLVAFDTTPTWDVPFSLNTNPLASSRSIRELGPAGGTDICPALQAAAEALEKLPAESVAMRHIILLTDGDSQQGDYASILRRMDAAKITLSTVAVGDDADHQLLSALANAGHGRYYAVSDPRVLPRIFIKEASVLRRPLITENPSGIPTQLHRSDSSLLQSLTQPEPVFGMVLTSRKPSPQVDVPIVAGKEGDPLLASWQAGLGRVTVFTSDASTRWGSRWIGSGGFGGFWSQLVRAVERAPQSADAELRARRIGNAVHIELDALGGDGGFQNFMATEANVIGPDAKPRAVTLTQTAPGLYVGDINAKAPGDYVVVTNYQSSSSAPGIAVTGFNIDAARELRELRSNEAAMRNVAARTGGRVLAAFDPNADLFTRDGLLPSRSYLPLRDVLFPLALVALLLDVAVRKISLGTQAFRRMKRPVWQNNRRAIRAAGPTNEQTSSALLRARDRTRKRFVEETDAVH